MRRMLVGIQVLVILVALGLAPARRIESAAGRPSQPAASAEIERLFRAGYLGDYASAVTVRGNYVYAGLGHELAVLNVADPAHPRQVGYVLLPGVVKDISIVGSLAYVAAGDAGLRVISLANLTAPVEIGARTLIGKAIDVAVAGRYAYVAAGEGGLRIVDVANPAVPVEVGSYSIPSGWRSGAGEQVAVSGNYAYIAAGASGLRIVNITNPAAPVEVYGDPLDPLYNGKIAETVAIQVAGRYAYVGVISEDIGSYESGHLRTIDISNPARPVKIGDYIAGGASLALAIDADYAYLGTTYASLDCGGAWNELTVLDLSNDGVPARIGSYRPATPTQAMASGDHYLYLAAGDAGLEILDLMRPASLVQVAMFKPAAADVLASAGRYAYVADGEELRIVDVADPAAPVVVGAHTFELNEECDYDLDSIRDIAVVGRYAYVTADDGELFVVDVSQPSSPLAVGDLSLGGGSSQVAIAGTYAYIVGNWDGLHIVDIAHPSAPVDSGAFPVQYALSVAVAGHYAYVGAENSPAAALHIIDVADPAHPSEVAIFSTPGAPWGSDRMDAPLDIAIDGNYAYLATGLTGLRILDISNPAEPIDICAFYIKGRATSVAVDGDRAYVASQDSGLVALDITNPAAPVQIDAYNTPSKATAVAVANGTIYTDNGGGLAILRLLNLPQRVYLPLVDR